MKQKKIAFMGLAAIATLGLASCGSNPATPTTTSVPTPTTSGGAATSTPTATATSVVYPEDTKGLDIFVNYQSTEGITYRGDTVVSPLDGLTYSEGSLLPVWKSFQSTLKTTFRDASNYSDADDAASATSLSTSGYKSQTDTSQYVDLFYNTTTEINSMGGEGKAVNLLDYLDYMPNFKAFLENNPTIAKQITKSGEIYYTPYFDGYNVVERLHVMDPALVEAVLDSASTANFDTTVNGKNAAANVLQASKLTPFIDANKNYPDGKLDVKISVNSEAKTITVAQTNNIIKQQNELLANGCTGKELADQFRAYLNTVYGNYVGADKYYKKLSDIFLSESAAYNTDELLALMRVVKANPGVITGDANSEIEVCIIRQNADNRVMNICHLMNIFGIQGMDAEKDYLYFDANGKINDATTTAATYEALEYLSAMYDEGLILNDFYKKTVSAGDYLGKYFGKTTDNGGYGLMIYDFAPASSANNTRGANGIGKDDSKRVGDFKNTSVKVRPVLPPVTWWATGTEWDHEQALSNHSNMELMRRSTSNATLKSTSWCIPASSDNKETAARLMDYLFTAEGKLINDFGPKTEQFWKSTTELVNYDGEMAPLMSDALVSWISQVGGNFYTFMRKYLGATHGVGYVRSSAIKNQAMNDFGQVGQRNFDNAVIAGVLVLDKVDKHGTEVYSYDNSVPSAGYGSETSKNDYAKLTDFWSMKKCADTATGWAKVIVLPAGTFISSPTSSAGSVSGVEYSYKEVKDQISARITKYLYDMVFGYDPDLLPEYAQ